MPNPSELERIDQEKFVEPTDTPSFRDELATLINKHSIENGSNTPDFVLADFLTEQLQSFNRAVSAREEFHGRPNMWLNNG